MLGWHILVSHVFLFKPTKKLTLISKKLKIMKEIEAMSHNTNYESIMKELSLHGFLQPWKKMFWRWSLVLKWHMRHELLLNSNCFNYNWERKNLKKNWMTKKKRSQSLEEYLRDFKNLCYNSALIKKASVKLRQSFSIHHGLGQRYKNVWFVILVKSPYHSFS